MYVQAFTQHLGSFPEDRRHAQLNDLAGKRVVLRVTENAGSLLRVAFIPFIKLFEAATDAALAGRKCAQCREVR